MNLTPKIMHHRSLSLSILAVILASIVCSGAPLSIEWVRTHLYGLLPAALVFLFCGWLWLNLIRDVARSYAPARCQMAAVLLSVASCLALLGIGLRVVFK